VSLECQPKEISKAVGGEQHFGPATGGTFRTFLTPLQRVPRRFFEIFFHMNVGVNCSKGKGKTVSTVTGLEWPTGFQEVKVK
jgi:hypothetical protein